MVGGFVEDEQIAADQRELGQGDPPPFTTRQIADAFEDIVTTKQKASEEGAGFGFFEGGPDAAHFVEDTIGHRQPFMGLGVVVDLDVAAQAGITAQGW